MQKMINRKNIRIGKHDAKQEQQEKHENTKLMQNMDTEET